MHNDLPNAVARYVRAVAAKKRAEESEKRASGEIRSAEGDIHRICEEIVKIADDKVAYIEGGDETVVVVSKTILEICPLKKGFKP